MRLLLLILFSTFIQKSVVSERNNISVLLEAKGDNIIFTITNSGDKNAKVCTYHTPFEGYMADYFEVKTKMGTNVEYYGTILKRKPPEKDDYITIPSGKSISATISLKEGYNVKKGKYSVKYIGNEYTNKLPNSNKITVIIKQ